MIESAKYRVNKAFEEKNKEKLSAMIQSNNNVFSLFFGKTNEYKLAT